ncbi:MAG: ferrous iron transport protein B [Acidobacteriota bacterium]
MKVGDKGEIWSVQAKGEIRRRILDMGLISGVKFKVVRVAPLGDPIEIRLRGFHLSLRKEEAATISVQLKGHIGDGVPMRKHGPLHSPFSNHRNNNDNRKDISVALVGNPNSGKTSIFNLLVGSNRQVGNFTGVTVEKHEGLIKYKGYSIKVIDLPGTYSLSAYSPEEVITRNYLLKEKTDVVIDVVDGSNLERNLYLTTQLMELGTDMLVALNMYDEVKKSEISIDFKQLQTLLGSHVIPTSAVSKTGFTSLLDHIIRVFEGKITISKNKLIYSDKMEEVITSLEEVVSKDEKLTSEFNSRWFSIKLLENDQLVHELVRESPISEEVKVTLEDASLYYNEKYRSDTELIITEDRHSFIRGAMKETVIETDKVKASITDKIDSVLLNRVMGLPIFIGIMWLIFQFTFTIGNPFVEMIESLFSYAGSNISGMLPEGVFRSLITDGVIAGVGGVVVFLPNIILLFLAIALLEGSGYMARAAFVIDKVMHKAGLHGKSFIPMLTGFGCSVPAIMATRTLKNRSDRIVTMLIIPFMSCGAKLPVYILLIGAFFPSNLAGNVLFGIYMFGVLIAIISAKILKKAFFKDESEPFVMELPPYRMPTLKSIFYQTNFKAKMYLKKAGTVILLASILIWGASNFPKNSDLEDQFTISKEDILEKSGITDIRKDKMIKVLELEKRSKQLEYSLAGRIGKFIEPGISPLGFDWRIGVALTAGFAAKEIVVSTLGTIFSLGDVNEQSEDLAKTLGKDPAFSIPVALSLMIFVLLYVPCIAATTVFHKENGSWKWTRFFILYTIAMAWIMSFLVYRGALLFFN